MFPRVKNFFLLLLCVGYYVFRGGAKQDVKSSRRVLIVQLAKLGDMVSTTPMFRAIKARYPDAKVYVMGDRVNKELLLGNTDVDEYIVYEKNIFGSINRLRGEDIDFSCMTGPSPEILAMLYLSGIRLITAPRIENGFSPQETRVYKMLSQFVWKVPHRMGHYAAREYLRLLEPIGIMESDTTKHLIFSEESRKKVDRFFNENNLNSKRDFLVGIFPSTGYEIKRWPSDRFACVADYLIEKYNAVIIVPGSERDRMRCEEMIGKIAHKEKVVSGVGKFSLDELKALIANLKLFISVDTGPIYIADAFGVPTIDIVGPMDDREQPPIGGQHKIVKVDRKEPMLHVMNTGLFDYQEAIRQRDGITVEMVTKAVDELMRTHLKNRFRSEIRDFRSSP